MCRPLLISVLYCCGFLVHKYSRLNVSSKIKISNVHFYSLVDGHFFF